MTIIELKKLAVKFRIECLKSIHKALSGHTGGSMSCMEILVSIYFGEIEGKRVMACDPKKPGWSERDYFILSKGHACPALYTILANLGFFDKEELNHLRQIGSLLQGHPIRKIPGIEATTGPLGQGLSFANGIALALKLDKKPNRVYVLLGDGELQEGQVWEAALTSAHYKLDNLIAFVDNNRLQIDGFVRTIKNIEPIKQKFESFGWQALHVADGHDFNQLLEAIKRAWKANRQPTVIVCDTIKGKGVLFAENNVSYHGVALSKEEMDNVIPLLEKELSSLSQVH